ncbi:T9SS type A sorting domain-containing protein [bacterium]|nr:T9SS type A sorting domain-containing protein [bacterium]
MDIFPLSGSPYRLDDPMWHYNFNTDTALLNRRLVELFVEAAALADADLNFAEYDAVVVIHAGVGKDFNIGFDNTPFDIPSAYISESDLLRYGGAVPTGLTRGLLIPECQNQSETLELGIELSLNGVLIKLFGNWLGLPDLYNTSTGASGIGRFGMMDQGSGNVNALVPCIPDAWTRMFMGWETASIVRLTGAGDTVRVARFGVEGAPEIVRVPITPIEYYLIENRDADKDSIGHVRLFDRDGREMQIDLDGDLAIEEGFRIPVRASHYDFGIPGSGLLIWRIDERVIEEKYATNSINADPHDRGVELAEADGSRDIGREFGFATAGSGTELGIAEDCWYRDNRAYRDANGGTPIVRFNDNTHPSARLKDHSFTFLELSDFSDVDSVMSVRVKLPLVQPGFPVEFDGFADWRVADLDGDGAREVYFLKDDSLFVVNDSTGKHLVLELPDGISFTEDHGPTDLNSDGKNELWFDGYQIGRVSFDEGEYVTTFVRLPAGFPETWAQLELCRNQSGDGRIVVASFWGDTGSTLLEPSMSPVYDYDLQILYAGGFQISDYSVVRNSTELPTTGLLFAGDHGSSFWLVSDSLSLIWTRNDQLVSPFPTVLIEPTRTSVYFHALGYVDLTSGELICGEPSCVAPLEDWDRDGVADGGGPDGSLSSLREGFRTGQVIDLDVDGAADAIAFGRKLLYRSDGTVTSQHTQVSCYDHSARLYSDFPWSIGGTSNDVFSLSETENALFIMSVPLHVGVGSYALMRLPGSTGTGERIPFVLPAGIIWIGPRNPQVLERGDEFAYVWPNPASSIANVRVTLPFVAEVVCSIYDLAGREIAMLSQTTPLQGATEIPWDVTNVASGVYIARVVAKGGGEERACEIKIAVVK